MFSAIFEPSGEGLGVRIFRKMPQPKCKNAEKRDFYAEVQTLALNSARMNPVFCPPLLTGLF